MSGSLTEGDSREPDPGLLHCAMHQRKWLLWRAQKMAFFLLYDIAGGLVLLNGILLATVSLLAWSVATILQGWFWALAGTVAVLAPLILAAQAGLISELLAEEEFQFRRFWRGARRFGAPVFALSALYGFAGCVAASGAWFYSAQLMPARPWAGAALAGLCLGTLALLFMSFLFSLPALVYQRGMLRKALPIGFALVARYPALAFGLLLLTLAWGVVLATPPGLLLVSTWPVVALAMCTYELLDRANRLEEAIARGENPPAGALDEDNIYLNRGFTDLLFPWKM